MLLATKAGHNGRSRNLPLKRTECSAKHSLFHRSETAFVEINLEK